MHHWLLDHFVCLDCKTGPLKLAAKSEQNGQVMEGALSCLSCDVTYPIRKGIPRFVDSDKYVDSYSFQRRVLLKHRDFYTTEDSAQRLFPDLTPIPIEEYKKGLLLDAGCGYGRWVRFFSERGVRVIGVDLSTDSVEFAASVSGARENVGLIQADLYNLPFPVGHFDNIFSFGVLDHTPDTKTAVGHVVKHLKPGGHISIYVYPVSPLVDAYRRVTTRLPTRLFYTLSVLHNYLVMSWMRHLGPIWRIYARLVPVQGAKKAWQRVHTELDQYTPVYAHRTTYPTVYGWFRDLGMEDIRLTKVQIAVTAKQPESETHKGS